MGDSCFGDFDSGDFNSALNFVFKALGNFKAGTAERFFVALFRFIVRIFSYDVAKSRITLGGKKFDVVINVENSLCRIGNVPDYNGSDDNGVAELVVYFLFIVGKGDFFKGNAFVGGKLNVCGGCFAGGGCFRICNSCFFKGLFGSGVDCRGKGIYEEKSGAVKGSVVFTEKGENISFVGAKGAKSAKKDRKHYKSKYSTKDHKNQRKREQKSAVEHDDSADEACNGHKFAENEHKEHCHSVFGVKNFVVIVFYVCVH